MQSKTEVSNILRNIKWYHLDHARLTITFLLRVKVAGEINLCMKFPTKIFQSQVPAHICWLSKAKESVKLQNRMFCKFYTRYFEMAATNTSETQVYMKCDTQHCKGPYNTKISMDFSWSRPPSNGSGIAGANEECALKHKAIQGGKWRNSGDDILLPYCEFKISENNASLLKFIHMASFSYFLLI